MRLIDADRLQTAFLADLDTAMSSYSGDMVQIMLIDIDECPTVDAALVEMCIRDRLSGGQAGRWWARDDSGRAYNPGNSHQNIGQDF